LFWNCVTDEVLNDLLVYLMAVTILLKVRWAGYVAYKLFVVDKCLGLIVQLKSYEISIKVDWIYGLQL